MTAPPLSTVAYGLSQRGFRVKPCTSTKPFDTAAAWTEPQWQGAAEAVIDLRSPTLYIDEQEYTYGYLVVEAWDDDAPDRLHDMLGEPTVTTYMAYEGGNAANPRVARDYHHGWWVRPVGDALWPTRMPYGTKWFTDAAPAWRGMNWSTRFARVRDVIGPEYEIAEGSPFHDAMIAPLRPLVGPVVWESATYDYDPYEDCPELRPTRSGWAAVREWEASAAVDFPGWLAQTGWTEAGRASSCGCTSWRHPWGASSPTSAIQHEMGCHANRAAEDRPVLAVWSSTAQAQLGMQPGKSTIGPFDFYVAAVHGGDRRAALTDLGIDPGTPHDGTSGSGTGRIHRPRPGAWARTLRRPYAGPGI